MADTVLRLRILVVRRNGVITDRIQVRVPVFDDDSPDVDPYAGPTYRDFSMMADDPASDIASDADLLSVSTLAEYGMVEVTQAWEMQYIE